MKSKIASANTASKQEIRYPSNYPKYIESGEGCYVFDRKGNKYIDFVCSLGPIILGHSYSVVDDAVRARLSSGILFSMPHRAEDELAEIICDMIPSAEMVRFTTNGKDATEAAVRLARHITGREVILSFSYHGAVDTFMASSPVTNGVPKCLKKLIYEFDYNDIKKVEELFKKHKVACVIMEPHTIRMPENGFLKYTKQMCKKNGALLIFDEIVSFPRYPGYSAQKYFNVFPDLTCISKGMANGYPISALVGRREYMKELKDGGVFVSTTFGGNLVGCSASIATLKEVRDEDVPNWLQYRGKQFYDEIHPNPYFKKVGLPWRQFFEYKDKETQTKFMQELIKEGVFLGIPIFFNFSMDILDIRHATRAINRVIDRMDKVKLEGHEIKEVFKKR